MSEERLQKILARAGVASRRAAETLIVEGRVKVDGRVVSELGVRVDPRKARIDLDGKRLVAEPFVYVILHKPRGVMCTLSDPEGRPTVVDLLKGVGVRVVPVGRLDFHTSGALLCTNDGDFAEKILHPRGGAAKEYVAKVQGLLTDESLALWSESIEIEGRATRPAEVRLLRHEGEKSWLTITLHEGRNRQVRRLGEATGFPVLRLARVAHAGITTEGLRPGQWRHLGHDELVLLKKAYGVPRVVHHPNAEALARRSATQPRQPRSLARKVEQRGKGKHAPRPFEHRDEPRANPRTREARPSESHSTRGREPRVDARATGPQGDTYARPRKNQGGASKRPTSGGPQVERRGPSRGATAKTRGGRGPSGPRGTSR